MRAVDGQMVIHVVALANGLDTATPFIPPATTATGPFLFVSFDAEPFSSAAGMAFLRCETVARGNRDLEWRGCISFDPLNYREMGR